MEFATKIERMDGVDVTYGCGVVVGSSGNNKNCSLARMFELAYQTKANIIAKVGPTGAAYWYLKKIDLDTIEEKIRKQEWRDTSRLKLWIIHW